MHERFISGGLLLEVMIIVDVLLRLFIVELELVTLRFDATLFKDHLSYKTETVNECDKDHFMTALLVVWYLEHAYNIANLEICRSLKHWDVFVYTGPLSVRSFGSRF